MKKIIETIKNFFENNDWKYVFKDDKVFISGINMGNVLGDVRMIIFLRENAYTVYMILNCKAEKKYYPVVAEFLHRANYGLENGNFEMDYSDGEIRYKTFINLDNNDISEEIVARSIFVGASMIDQYGKGLVKILIGEGTPEECIKECEKYEEEEIE